MTLADQQAALVAALAGTAPAPAGFDADRIRAATDTLAFKRARAVARAWPSVHTMLGADFRERFAAYAATTPLPAQGGPLADGRRFVRFLAKQMPLSDGTRLQALSIDVHYRQTVEGLERRYWPNVGAAWLPDSHNAVVALGSHRFRLVLPRLRR